MILRTLKIRILASFFFVILVLSLSIALLGFYVIEKDIIARVQKTVVNDLMAARSFYTAEIDRIGEAFHLVAFDGDIEKFKTRINLDYAVLVDKSQADNVKSEIVRVAFNVARGVGGTRIISTEELNAIDQKLLDKSRIDIKLTPRARPTSEKTLSSVMAKEYAMPLLDKDGNVEKIIYGGRIINRDYALVDKIRALVFGNELYGSKPVGTVTIFQNGTRIATNVLDENGNRAIGTAVSEQVYKKVVDDGKIFHDRAFVVTDWYKTAYEPIRNIEGEIVGILYVGMLEKPFDDMAKNIIWLFLLIVFGATVLAVFLSFVLAFRISRPITDLLNATIKISKGALGYEVQTRAGLTELNKLAESFNEMSTKLHERELSLKISNEKLEASNKSYVDLIGFVAHELKGILAPAVVNAYSIRDGFLGMINFKQRRAIDSITRNLDYLTATVKKFLNLGRIEKGELSVHKTKVMLRKDIFDVSADSMLAMISRKKIKFTIDIPIDLSVNADADLMMIVANNLLSNAIKYGRDEGNVAISYRESENKIEVDVYNDSQPIGENEINKMFKKFSRLNTPDTKNVKGTGLGLYITKQIIENHNGKIWVAPRENGNSIIFQIERGF